MVSQIKVIPANTKFIGWKSKLSAYTLAIHLLCQVLKMTNISGALALKLY